MYKTFKIEQLKNSAQYNWFKTFANPCYGFNVKMDVTQVVKTSKQRGTSFFANTLFLVTKALNSVDEMRMREVNGEIRPVRRNQSHVHGDDGKRTFCQRRIQND